MRSIACIVAATLLSTFAHAAPPVSGTLVLKGRPVAVSHVAALLHDNADGSRSHPLTIVFSDRAFPASELRNESQHVWAFGRGVKMSGLVLAMDPEKPNSAYLIPMSTQDMMATRIVEGPDPVVKGLKIENGRIRGELSQTLAASIVHERLEVSLRFDAPLSRPTTARTEAGAAAVKREIDDPAVIRASGVFATVSAWEKAMKKGDIVTMRSLMSEEKREAFDMQVAAAGGGRKAAAEFRKLAEMMGGDMTTTASRIVEHGGRAVLSNPRGASVSLVKEGQAWRIGGD